MKMRNMTISCIDCKYFSTRAIPKERERATIMVGMTAKSG